MSMAKEDIQGERALVIGASLLNGFRRMGLCKREPARVSLHEHIHTQSQKTVCSCGAGRFFIPD